MVVGHNPGLTELANHLIPRVVTNLPTCGLVSVTIDTDTWNLPATAEVKLVACDYPKKQA